MATSSPRSTTLELKLKRASWLPDRQAKCCMEPLCNTMFSLRERRHHCRMCGKIFCSLHTGYTKLAAEPSTPTKDHRFRSTGDTRSSSSRSSTSSMFDTATINTTASTAEGHQQMVRVCNNCFLSVHDSEQIHEEDECVPAGFICYIPYGPPFLTGPGGLGDLRDVDGRRGKSGTKSGAKNGAKSGRKSDGGGTTLLPSRAGSSTTTSASSTSLSSTSSSPTSRSFSPTSSPTTTTNSSLSLNEHQDQVQEESCPRLKRLHKHKNRSREESVDTLEDTTSTSRERNKRNRIIQPTMHAYVLRTGSMLTKIKPRQKSSYVPSDTELRNALEDTMQNSTFCDANGTRVIQNEAQVLRTLRKEKLYWRITPSRTKEILRTVEKNYLLANNL